MESGDWRAQLQSDSRQSMVNKIFEASERYLPTTGHKGLLELKKVAVQCEEKIYTAATSQSEYLHKISSALLSLERPQNSVPDLVQANNGLNPLNLGVPRAGYRYGFCGGNIVYEGKGTQPWTEEEDEMLVDTLMELHVSGKFVYADIKSDYVNAVHQLMDPDKIYPDNYFSRNSLRHRMTTIENDFWKYHSHRSHGYNKRFPHYDKLCTIFVKDATKGSEADGLGVKAKDVVKENQIIPCFEDKELHVSENLSSFYGVQENESSKRKRNEGDEVDDNCVESKVANHGSNAVNDTMSKVATQMKDLPRLTLNERLMAMSVIGRSEPLSVMFDQLDQEGKVRMAQMVAVGAIS